MHIGASASSHFDPEVVQIFLELVRHGRPASDEHVVGAGAITTPQT